MATEIKVGLEFGEGMIYIRYTANEPGMNIDGGELIEEGGRYCQYTYEQLRAMGSGEVTLKIIEQAS